jgi:hypothetical protein
MGKGKNYMSDAEREQMARELIAAVAADWINREHSYVLKEGEAYTFTFIIPRPGGNTVISYNPFVEAVAFIRTAEMEINAVGADEYPEVDKRSIRSSSEHWLRHMLTIARRHFEGACDTLRVMADTEVRIHYSQAFGGRPSRKGRCRSSRMARRGWRLTGSAVGRRVGLSRGS